MHIVIENKSVYLHDSEGQKIVEAIQTLLPVFCSDWNLSPPTLTYLKRTRQEFFYDHSAAIIVITDALQFGTTPAFHTVHNGKPSGTIFAKSLLKTKHYSIAKFLCHEVFEMLLNPELNKSKGGYCLEVCDPVQMNDVNVGEFTLSDWVLPSWFDVDAKRPFNHNDTLCLPFSIDAGGYIYGR
jgi:hypothetical protein